MSKASTNSAKRFPWRRRSAHKNGNQQILFTALDREVLEKLRDADLDQLKPLDALNLLAELKKQIS